MKKRSFLFPGLFLALAALSLPLHAASVRTVEQDFTLSGATLVKVKISVGDLDVVGTSSDKIKVQADVRCKNPNDTDCKEAAERISVGSRRSGDELVVEIEGFPKLGDKGLSIVARVEVPQALPLLAHSGVGDIAVSGMTNNVEVDAGVGDVRIKLKSANLKSAELDTGIGDVELTIDGNTVEGSGFIGKGLDWTQGKGSAKLEVDCGVGDIRVTIE